MRARSIRSSRTRRFGAAALACTALLAACSSDDDAEPATTEAPPATDAPVTTDAPTATDATPGTTPDTTPAGESDFTSRVPDLPPPTGETMKIGVVNSEGTPGLDFPEIREDLAATFDYLNEHGGLGGRPVELTTCASKGSPETSQACAEQMAGAGVELVLLGLDLFPGYATYEAAGLPVIGLLPILPGDYTAKALFVTGGNATLAAGMAGVAKERFDAKSVGIISADNAGSNGTEAALKASLDKLGIKYVSIKGGNEETDAGYQGLMAQANEGNPDLLISLYDGNGCIGTMRGRTTLGITTPVLAANTCAATEVIDQVGADAEGWLFLGAQTNDPTPANELIKVIMAPVLDVSPDEVDPSALGLGGLGIVQAMTLAQFADAIVADGGEVTGQSLYDFFGSARGLSLWPSGLPAECGKATNYPSICSFEFPVIEYVGGKLQAAEGLETVSAFEYLP